MKVIHITTAPESLFFFDGQVGYLKSRGVEIGAISSPGGRLADFGAKHGIRVHAVTMRRRITPLRDLVSVVRLWMLFRRLRPDIVHASTPKAGLLGMIAAFLARTPVRVFHLHGLPHLSATGLKHLLLLASSRVSCALAHRVFCVSHSIAEIAYAFCEKSRIVVWGSGSADGVDSEERFNPDRIPAGAGSGFRQKHGIPPAAAVVTFVGRLVRDKGLVELSQAWRILSAEFPTAYLVIAGDFDPQDPISVEVTRWLSSHPRVRLCGFIGDTPALYMATDLLALPSYREGLPTVALEANSMALPVVTTRVPGCIDAVEDGITGALAQPRDAVSLAHSLRGYLASPSRRIEHGQAGRQRVLRDFRPEPIRKQSLEEYQRLLRARQVHSCLPVAKRIFDILVSIAALAALLPAMGLIALAIRAKLGSPLLFRQVRPGLGETSFTLLKFRTMDCAVDAAGLPMPDSERLTAFGRWLRTTSLDELPALWNVLKGEMSLVGPRPLLPEYLPLYSSRQRRRHEVRPGITGWAQVNGRNELSWSERFELDLWYLDHRSFFLDVGILLLTVWTIIRGRGIVHAGHASMPRFEGGHPEVNS